MPLGELIRCQDTNLPAEIRKGARKALTAERLGHSVVFRLNHKVGALGIQFDARVVSPGRILDYVASYDPKAIYSMLPYINKDAWKKFTSGDTRKLALRIAGLETCQVTLSVQEGPTGCLVDTPLFSRDAVHFVTPKTNVDGRGEGGAFSVDWYINIWIDHCHIPREVGIDC